MRAQRGWGNVARLPRAREVAAFQPGKLKPLQASRTIHRATICSPPSYWLKLLQDGAAGRVGHGGPQRLGGFAHGAT
jgi:hypothetical protein